MITAIVPTFDEFNNYSFSGYKEVKIKNTPDWKDVNKIAKYLPGIPQGGIGRHPLRDLLQNKQKAVRDFYDSRQNTKKLKGFYITLKIENIHDLRIQLGNAMIAQGYGPDFSPRLESRINKLKKKINSNNSAWLPSIHG